MHSNKLCALDGGCPCPFWSQPWLNWGVGRLAGQAHEEAEGNGASAWHCSSIQSCHTAFHPRYTYFLFSLTIGWMVYNDEFF